MSTMKRMTLEDIKAYQPTSEELERAKTFKNTDFSDCPKMTKEDLEKFHRVGSIYKPLKTHITLRLDNYIISIFKAGGKGYQTRINEALREYVSEHPELTRTLL